MADAPDIRKALEDQIAELKKEVAGITETLSEYAEDTYKGTSRAAGKAVARVRQQGAVVADAVKDNPGTATTVLATVGIIGFVAGYVLGCASTDKRQSRFWH